MAKNRSEELFEHYLDNNGYEGLWEYEAPVKGQEKKPDYILDWQGGQVFFEVKETQAQELSQEVARFFDPYKKVRAKIDKARPQFRSLAAHNCSLVLHNVDDPDVCVDPLHVLAAMLGNLGFSEDINLETGQVIEGSFQNIFMRADRNSGRNGGKMLNPDTGKPRNTRIGSIIIVEIYRDRAQLREAGRRIVIERESELGRGLTPPERIGITAEVLRRHNNICRDVVRVVVVENPFAQNALPDGLFRGEYDERWRWNPDTAMAMCVFRGAKVEQRRN